jgi:hypothetical protein
MRDPSTILNSTVSLFRVCRLTIAISAVSALLMMMGCRTGGQTPDTGLRSAWLRSWHAANNTWRGVHMSVHNDDQAQQLLDAFPKLAALGVNALVLEVNYGFDFQTHPELRATPFLSRARARELAAAARATGIRLIPQFNCLGHQSWSRNTAPLLVRYPEFDETPGQYPENKGIYCRSWCPQNPKVNPVVFALIDELVDAFEADAFHVGMDEVFLIASEHCPRCRDGNPAELFAKAVNDLHGHITGKRKLEMLMWGDRLLPSKTLGYSEWEASRNGTEGAADLIPKDIIICDWHYEKRAQYPSVPLLMERGFRVWPSGWQPLEASKAFSAFARQQRSPRMLGYLCTTWGKVRIPEAVSWPPISEVMQEWK